MDDLKIDREKMHRLAKALMFICASEKATIDALKKASETGDDYDIKNARFLFLKLKPAHRNAAMALLTTESDY